MHHPTDRIAHTTAFVTPVVEHWLEQEIAQWVHPTKDRSDDPSHHERTLLPRSYISLPSSRITRFCVFLCVWLLLLNYYYYFFYFFIFFFLLIYLFIIFMFFYFFNFFYFYCFFLLLFFFLFATLKVSLPMLLPVCKFSVRLMCGQSSSGNNQYTVETYITDETIATDTHTHTHTHTYGNLYNR